MSLPTIGILGGMGPRATVQFEQLLLDRLPGTDQQLPTIISVNDGAIPDRSAYLLGKGLDPVFRLQHNLEMLEQMDARIVAIPCNTACAPRIFNRLRTAVNTKLVNLPAEVGFVLAEKQYRRVAILATEGTVAAGVYQRICKQRNIESVIPNAATQQLVSKVIRAVKQGDVALARLFAVQVAHATERLRCEAVILGCTELPLVGDFLVPRNVAAIDTLAVLADAVTSYTTKQRKGVQNDTRSIYA